MSGFAVTAGARIPHESAAPLTGRYKVIFPTGDVTEYATIELALAAAVALNTVLGAYGSATGLPYAPGMQYVSFKTSANPILNCFTGGATLGQPHTYVDLYYATLAPLPANIADSGSLAQLACTFMASEGAMPADGLAYLDRERDPVVTGNNVNTTAWGPFSLTGGTVAQPATAQYPFFMNNCTNYSSGPVAFPQAIMAPFTIIRNLDG